MPPSLRRQMQLVDMCVYHDGGTHTAAGIGGALWIVSEPRREN